MLVSMMVTGAFLMEPLVTTPGGRATEQIERVTDRQQLEQLNSVWMTSYETRDRQALAGILADDFTGFYGEAILSKQQMLDALATRPPTKVTWEDVRIHISGDTAVVAARSTVTTTRNGAESQARFSYADIYALRDDRWRAIASHVIRAKE